MRKKTKLYAYCLPSIYGTLNIIETQLSSFVLAPSKHSSGQREGKAVVSARGDLCQRNPCQRLDGLWKQLAGLALPQSELTAGVLTPREQLTISTENNSTVHSRTALSLTEKTKLVKSFLPLESAMQCWFPHITWAIRWSHSLLINLEGRRCRHLYLLCTKMCWKITKHLNV